ncbi:hypothetical protein M089_4341 [Bacteroides ovatus str. 3725 D9 iii]|nr:hypothetical protein M089_4341 [Bacteroides ovatus str. 3725 D9 iii]
MGRLPGNPGAVSTAVLDAGRPLYLCIGKSNRQGSADEKRRGKK